MLRTDLHFERSGHSPYNKESAESAEPELVITS